MASQLVVPVRANDVESEGASGAEEPSSPIFHAIATLSPASSERGAVSAQKDTVLVGIMEKGEHTTQANIDDKRLLNAGELEPYNAEGQGHSTSSTDEDDDISKQKRKQKCVEGVCCVYRRTRGTIAWVLIIVACILIPFTAVIWYLRRLLVDTDYWVAVTTPMASNDIILNATADYFSTQSINVLEQQFPGNVKSNDTLTGNINSTFLEVVYLPEYHTAWIEASRNVHSTLLAVLTAGQEGSDRVYASREGLVVLNLTELQPLAYRALVKLGVVAPQLIISQVNWTVILLNSSEVTGAQDLFTQANDFAIGLLTIQIVLLALAIIVAVSRRRAINRVGIGGVIAFTVLGVIFTILYILKFAGSQATSLGESATQQVFYYFIVPVSRTAMAGYYICLSVFVLNVLLFITWKSIKQKPAPPPPPYSHIEQGDGIESSDDVDSPPPPLKDRFITNSTLR